ncbi:thioredoxin-disulfide reductase [Anaeromicropila herbilytica]|uniref:Thioredoxin reductase n=1 Tax=Anaeromicropila herbilytica TaxID=2785025 RepID=A0A7R7EIU4_9FIRM|nr:thioredoxin-disulfide reductase [Anaeromicropila herbilytica]BCN29651.1 thioredoxin reductase [Anaeromicropila herbilytica]
MNKQYELIIIGSGPAGLTSAIYASRAEIDTLIIEKNPVSGGQIINTYEVDNYPGLPGINGFDLAMKFREHSEKLGASFVMGEVSHYDIEGPIKKITLDNGDKYEAKAVIIATGAIYRKLEVKGEKELTGMGVSYCATCDGAFFRNKTTVVVGGGDVAVEDAIFLARLCKKVYVIHRRDEFRAAKTLTTQLSKMENVEIIWDTVVDEIIGKELVKAVKVRNKKTNEEKTIDTDGVFIAVGNMPSSDVFKEILKTDEVGYIVADESCTTNIDGVFVAGDIRTKSLRQIITAASDGANAITSVERYLNGIS